MQSFSTRGKRLQAIHQNFSANTTELVFKNKKY